MTKSKVSKNGVRGSTVSKNARSNATRIVSSQDVPIAKSYNVQPMRPKISSSGRVTSVRNHELIATLNNSSAFSATKYALNPGLPLLTWLSDSAKKYEKYKWKKLQLVFVPENAVTTTAGRIHLAADYDPQDSAPSGLAAMSSYETYDSRAVYKELCLPISVGRMFDGIQAKKIRCGPVGGDLQLFDGCSLIVATIGGANSNAIGELFLEYEVDLISPQVEPSPPAPPSILAVNLSAEQTLASSVAEAVDFDEAVVSGFALDETLGVITLPCGFFHVSGYVTVADSANEVVTASIEVMKNASALSPAAKATVIAAATGTFSDTVVPFDAYVQSDGTDTLSIMATVIGAAGTLTLPVDQSKLNILAL